MVTNLKVDSYVSEMTFEAVEDCLYVRIFDRKGLLITHNSLIEGRETNPRPEPEESLQAEAWAMDTWKEEPIL